MATRKFGVAEARRMLDALRERNFKPSRDMMVMFGVGVSAAFGIPNVAAAEAEQKAFDARDLAENYRERAQNERRTAHEKITRVQERIWAIIARLNKYVERRVTLILNHAETQASVLLASATAAQAEADKADEVAHLF